MAEGPAASPNKNWRHAIAGATAGLASVLATHPLDLIKTRLQGGHPLPFFTFAAPSPPLCRVTS